MKAEQKQRKENKPLLFTLFLITFIDLLGVGIVIPVLPVIFFSTDILPATVSNATRTFLLGLLIASFPFAQFFGAPILGTLSDQVGRKKVLLFSLFGTFIGYILFAFGIAYTNIYLLFASRLLDGFTGGNISIVQSAIADVSTPQTKVKNFGIIGMAFGLGFILGPFIGGKLTDTSLVSWFTHATPFWFAACLVFFNLILVCLYFKETLHVKQKLDEKQEKRIHLFTGFQNIKKAFMHQDLRVLFFVIFLMNFGWSFFTQFFQVFLYHKFSFTSSDIGTYFAYVGLWIAIAQGVVVRFVSSIFAPHKVLRVSILATALVLLIITLPNEALYLYLTVPFMAIFFGMTSPNFSTMLSNAADAHTQGEIMGIQQSLLSLSFTIPPLIAGIVITWGISLPILLASGTIFTTWCVFVFGYKHGPIQKIQK